MEKVMTKEEFTTRFLEEQKQRKIDKEIANDRAYDNYQYKKIANIKYRKAMRKRR